MEIRAIEYKAIKTTRILTAGSESRGIQTIWIGLHGYGQLPEFFIKKMTPLVDSKTLVCCPEGLSKFYLNGTNGRVGASWMTKDNRLTEISDYSNYLQDFLSDLKQQYKPKSVFVLGFSQGGATAVRWLELKKPKISGLVLWSTMFPEDISYQFSKDYFESFPVIHVYGNRDPYQPDGTAKVPEQPKCMTHVFNGGHEILKDTILTVRDILQEIQNSNNES